MGRPTKLTTKRGKHLVRLLEMGVPRERAARLSGIGERTFHRWMQQGTEEESGPHRQFRQAVMRAEDRLIDKMMSAVVDAFETFPCAGPIGDGQCLGPECPTCGGRGERFVHELRDRVSAARFAALRFPGDFSTKVDAQVTGKGGGPVQVEATVRPVFTDEQIASMTPEQLAAALKAV